MSTKYAYLGPAGTFTQAALLQITNPDDLLTPYANVTAALDAVRNGECTKALVPIENSVEGVVARTLDELAMGKPLVITAETTLPVSFALMSLPATEKANIKSIAAQGLAAGKYDAAIASPAAAKNYGLKVIAENIGDNENAITRFVLVEAPGEQPKATGSDRTSLAVFIAIDHAGALLEILTEFAKHDVNLSFIQSSPTGR